MEGMQFFICLIGLLFIPITAFGEENTRLLDFKTGVLDLSTWCPCQIDTLKAPVKFISEKEGSIFARIVANDGSLGGNRCRSIECGKTPGLSPQLWKETPVISGSLSAIDDEDGIEEIGFSFFSSIFEKFQIAPPVIKGSVFGNFHMKRSRIDQNPYCTKEKLKQAIEKGEEKEYAEIGICMQRQEVRFLKKYRHVFDEPYSYGIRFKMPATIQDRTNSLRWVIVQWKHNTDQNHYGAGFSPSPFLAQRFDDGVHHITIQDEHCRCMVASAPHPNSKQKYEWLNGVPKYCRSSSKLLSNRHCTPEFRVEYGDQPILTPPLGNWVTMKFQVQASRENAEIIIKENGRKIVRVFGKIGYRPPIGEPSLVKFKFGQYREYQNTEDFIDIDWISVRKID
jgi:hypothetical protein